MANNNRKCVVCGVEYEYCNTCRHSIDNNTTRWKTVFHDENCRQIYRIVAAYGAQQMSKEEAQEKLKSCDITINFVDNIRKVVEELVPVARPLDNIEQKDDSESDTETETSPKVSDDEKKEVSSALINRKPYDYKHGKKNRKK